MWVSDVHVTREVIRDEGKKHQNVAVWQTSQVLDPKITILCNGAQHPLQDVIVDNDVQETEAVEVAPEGQGKDGCHYKQLGEECAC